MVRDSRCYRFLFRIMLACMMLAGSSGCHLIFPDVCHQPMVHNPFPQLSRVAVAPFFNQSDEPTVDGRKFALAYFAELQATPGFEVVPLGVVEEAILAHQVDLSDAGEARRLAAILGVDVVVVGSVTDFDPYYPPRCGLRVEWYAANAGFHEIPPGYGLPWGTPEEEFIPEPLVFESEMALAKSEFASQTPNCPKPPLDPPPRAMLEEAPQLFRSVPSSEAPIENRRREEENDSDDAELPEDASTNGVNDSENTVAIRTLYEAEIAEEELPANAGSGNASMPPLPPQDGLNDTTAATGAHGASTPPCIPNNGPIMTHTRIYHGNDGDFTEALENYYHFRNDARFGGWQNYLQRSDDFIRFCCHMHISEMLSARGGADQTRVVWRWSDSR
jgi:hypothetical protein